MSTALSQWLVPGDIKFDNESAQPGSYKNFQACRYHMPPGSFQSGGSYDGIPGPILDVSTFKYGQDKNAATPEDAYTTAIDNWSSDQCFAKHPELGAGAVISQFDVNIAARGDYYYHASFGVSAACNLGPALLAVGQALLTRQQ